MYALRYDIMIVSIYSYYQRGAYIIIIAKQKHPRCKKSEAKSEAPVSFYSYMRLKSLISGGGQGPTELFVSNNVRSITYKFQKIRSLTLDVLQFEHN